MPIKPRGEQAVKAARPKKPGLSLTVRSGDGIAIHCGGMVCRVTYTRNAAKGSRLRFVGPREFRVVRDALAAENGEGNGPETAA